MKTAEAKQRYSYRAFVCYAHDDGEIAISVVQALEKAGLVGLLVGQLTTPLGFGRAAGIRSALGGGVVGLALAGLGAFVS